MRPELFRINFPDWLPLLPDEMPIFAYGAMLVIGFYAGLQLARFLAKRSRIDPDIFVNVGLIALLTGIVGARLSHVLENIDQYTSPARSARENFLDAINLRSGGLTFYGGLLLATPCCLLYGWYRKVNLLKGMDIIAPCVMVGLGFGRIGCYLNGCCHGAECNVPWAVQFPYGSNAYVGHYRDGRLPERPDYQLRKAPPDGDYNELKERDVVEADPELAKIALDHRSAPVHPAQLYSAFNAFLIACVLVAFFTLGPPAGRVFALMLILKGITRFVLEMLRAEPAVLGPLSFSMVLSIFLFAGGVIMWWLTGRRGGARPANPLPAATPVPGGA